MTHKHCTGHCTVTCTLLCTELIWVLGSKSIRTNKSTMMHSNWENSEATEQLFCQSVATTYKDDVAMPPWSMITDKQTIERRNHKHHGLVWSVLVVEGWYDTGYEITCRQNLDKKKTYCILTEDNRCCSILKWSFCQNSKNDHSIIVENRCFNIVPFKF